jgi:hypothetical protein
MWHRDLQIDDNLSDFTDIDISNIQQIFTDSSLQSMS